MDNPVLIFAAGELLIVVLMVALIRSVNGQDPEARQLYFGSVVLTAMALVFALGMAMYYFAPTDKSDRGAKIFDACIHIIPPLLTLVIGFYFGKRSETSPPPRAGMTID